MLLEIFTRIDEASNQQKEASNQQPGMSARGGKMHFIGEKGGAMLFVRVTKSKITLYGGLGQKF